MRMRGAAQRCSCLCAASQGQWRYRKIQTAPLLSIDCYRIEQFDILSGTGGLAVLYAVHNAEITSWLFINCDNIKCGTNAVDAIT